MATSNDPGSLSPLRSPEVKKEISKSLRRPRLPVLRPRTAIAAAAVFHLVVTLGVFGAGRFELYPQQIDSDGIGQFARDGYFFRGETELLANTLVQDGVRAWLASPFQIHIKAYSISFVLLRPVLGTNILVAEPVNLVCYLLILIFVFGLAKRMAGQNAAWLASLILALWPTFLLHTTQFLRDPILIAAILLLVLVLTDIIGRLKTWPENLIAGLLGLTASFVLWLSRPDMWLVVRVIVLWALLLLLVSLWRGRRQKLLIINLVVVVMLFTIMSLIPYIARTAKQQTGVSLGVSGRDEGQALWSRVAAHRRRFVTDSLGQSGSMIDADVEFSSTADVIRYIPRAMEIGYLAPFPSTWFKRGYNVGLVGRLTAGIETLLTYAFELLACVFLWQCRRRLDVWLLALTVMTGITALGLVVVNLGTLYRMRYPFWILMVIMAAGTLARLGRRSYPSHSR